MTEQAVQHESDQQPTDLQVDTSAQPAGPPEGGAQLTDSDLIFLQALPMDVDLDIAQVSSATRVPPTKALDVVRKLKGANKVEEISDVLDIGRSRYKRVAV